MAGLERSQLTAGNAALLSLLGFAAAWLTAPLMAAPEPSLSYQLLEDSSGRERLLVGILIGGREVGAMEVLRGHEFLLPLLPFASLTGSTVVDGEDAVRLETPIGTVDLGPAEIVEIDGLRYLTETAIEDKLATPISFDAEAFALLVDLAWRREGPSVLTSASDPLVPDAVPPAASLSSIRIDSRYTDSDRGSRVDTNTWLGGRIAGGRWQVRWQDDLEGNRQIQDYAWTRASGNSLWLAGHQRVHLHPLLPGLELTGLQKAWTNRPTELFERRLLPGELLPRRLRPTRTFEGRGPPAGLAELRIEGRPVARQTLGLDGRYAFYDVVLPNRQLNRVEIYVYDRHDLSVPVEIHERSRRTSEFLLPRGAQVHQGGLGLGGNLAQDFLDRRDGDDELASFYQGRYGLREGLTLEAAAQGVGGDLQLMAGLVTRLSDSFVVAAGVGAQNGAWGYHFELDGQVDAWRFRGRSQLNEAGFRLQDAGDETFDHVFEIGYASSPELDLSLIARRRQQGLLRADFVLPAFAWRPTPRFSLRAYPDSEGEYVADLSYALSRSTRFNAHYQAERAFLDLSYRLPQNFSLFFSGQVGGALEERWAAAVRWAGGGRWRPSCTAAALFSEGRTGFRIAATAAVLPGILLRLDWIDDPLPTGGRVGRNEQLTLGLTTDLTWNRGRIQAARSHSLRDNRGAIAGRVRIEAPPELRDFPLEDLRIRINGRARGRTLHGGSFFIGNLRPGLYRLELDNENLPIELTAERVSLVAEVSASAVTQVEFVVRPELGIAGRVTSADGVPLPGRRVELLDAAGALTKSAVTDRFGLYRIDGLPLGEYTLRLAAEEGLEPGSEAPVRSLVITGDFLFEQDLVVPEPGS